MLKLLALATLIRPIIPTLATLRNGLWSADVEGNFLLISPGLGIGGVDRDRVVTVVIRMKLRVRSSGVTFSRI